MRSARSQTDRSERPAPDGLPLARDAGVPGNLIARCKQGDSAAFGLLFETHRDRIHSLALYFTGDTSLAEDVTQDVFLKLLTRIHQLRDEAEYRSWLYRIVVNTCASHGRKAWRYVPFDEVANSSALVGQAPQAVEVARRQVMAELRSAFLALGPGPRLALLLRYVAGLTHQEIASVLAVPFGTAAARVARARHALGRRLSHLREPAKNGSALG